MKLIDWTSKHWAEVVRFLCIGGSATLLDLIVFNLCLLVLPSKETLSFVIGFSTSVLCRFFADKYFTFRAKQGKLPHQFALYLTSCLITLLIGVGVFNVLLCLNFTAFWSKIISIPFVTVAGYFLFKFIVFKKSNPQAL